MLKQTIDILSHYDKPQKRSVMGNVAVARGAIEAGVSGVFSYPGTPSTEISEVFNYVSEFQSNDANLSQYPQQTAHRVYFEYSINEKIALEKAIAYAIGNQNALCVMKNVGMNVASDALMSITYQTILGALVIIICDDPGCHSSSNEQDSRYWGMMASVPVFNPSTPAQALAQTKAAFELSKQIKLPVIVRLTTRVSHTRGMLQYGAIDEEHRKALFRRMPEHINIPARTAVAHGKLIGKLHSDEVFAFNQKYTRSLTPKEANWGIITSGVSTVYVDEILHRSVIREQYGVLDLGMSHPINEKAILDFFQHSFRKIIVLEELDPIIENAVRILVQKNKIKSQIFGKGFSTLSSTGEYSLDLLTTALYEFSKDRSLKSKKRLLNSRVVMSELPPRPPALCAGCPHRATYYALKLAVPKDLQEVILCGDIGCNGLGALPPLKMVDTINHMGMSISMAQGLSEALKLQQTKGKTIAMLGDGTFFHSGVTALLNAIYTKAQALVIIFDNRTIGMTGHQDHPGATHLSRYKQIDILSLVQGMGVAYAETMYPFDLKDTHKKILNAMQADGISVLISKAPCIFLPEFKEGSIIRRKVVVDHTKCNTCGNHDDMLLPCSRCHSAQSNLSRAKRKLSSDYHIPALEQRCPANICNHGFFQSVAEGNYKDAVKMVRDKMLFSRTCGNICHRPCEVLSQQPIVAPIKKMKHFVSSFDDNFTDISESISQRENSKKPNKKVAVIGAGPAGLSAAYDLLKVGYEVDLYDKESAPGGMLKYIIPYFRMDKSGLDFEASIPQQLGAGFFGNSILGKDIHLKQLSDTYHAVILSTGLWTPRTLDIVENHVPNHQKHSAIDFLKKVNLGEVLFDASDSFLVIGGGNSAVDAARAAKKLNTTNRVLMVCIEEREKMPAFEEEVEHALHEGIEIYNGCILQQCQSQNGDIQCSIQSVDGKKNIFIIVQHIITAIGQTSHMKSFMSSYSDEHDELLDVNPVDGYTGFDRIFAAGDICKGNHQSVIGAISSGKRAANGVRRMLEGYQYEYEGQRGLDNLNQDIEQFSRPKNLDVSDSQLLEWIQSIDLFQHCAKCNHCIDNFGCPAMIKVNGKIEIDYQKCTHCGLCIDVCPNNAISYVEEITTQHG
ncbi:MAG: FAD-dependent oxidoreductase [Candidatus Competibacteraceae bacterium]|nr:FAD-dependent oxidoreductase [Candidatus Competibacteraceae bacterium]